MLVWHCFHSLARSIESCRCTLAHFSCNQGWKAPDVIPLAGSDCQFHVCQTADIHLLAQERKETYPLPSLNLLDLAWLGRSIANLCTHCKRTAPIPHAGSG